MLKGDPMHRPPTIPSPRALLLSTAALLACTAPLLAHGGGDSDAPILLRWTWHTGIILSLAAVSALYALGLRNLWRSAGTGRGVQRRTAWSFAASILALIAALLSPIDPLSDDLAWMHMVQHMTLMMIAAPLFVLGAPATVMLWALPLKHRRRLGRALRTLDNLRIRGYLLWQPLVLWTLFAVTLWVWHLPWMYEAALRNDTFHDVQHLAFFGASCLFWRVLLDPLSRLRLNPALAVLYLFTSSLQATVLGIFMAIAPKVWYPWYHDRTEPWGLSAIEDQQLAGFIMWMPACLIYAIVAAGVFGVWLGNHNPEPADSQIPPHADIPTA
jgi:putative membrane protein